MCANEAKKGLFCYYESMKDTSLIVIGSLNTDIIGKGVKRLPEPGEHVWGDELVIGPGGKSRNIAAMAGYLLPPGRVAMIGRTVQDKFALWKPPIDALHEAGVSTEFIHIMNSSETKKLPAVALIPVDTQGRSEIMLLPGVSDDFDISDIDAAGALFETVKQNEGFFALTLECPIETAVYAVKKATEHNLKVVLDPGGIETDTDIKSLLKIGLYLFKPNEHETKMITGITVDNFESAQEASRKLHYMGARNVLITHGEHGAYLFTETGEAHHVPAPDVTASKVKDATGCGDQTMATLCVYLQSGSSLKEAAEMAILSGTLEFYKAGIQPITKEELGL